MNDIKELLFEFIDWARDNSDDAWYIYEYPEKAIEEFLKQREDE